MDNKMTLTFSALSQNEMFARTAVSGFIMNLDPTVEVLTDIKTAVSEAVTNCIVHGYRGGSGIITMECSIEGDMIHIKITDNGVGIEDIEKVTMPFYTTGQSVERAGMGFTIMRTFMDTFSVQSKLNSGTTVVMSKRIKNAS